MRAIGKEMARAQFNKWQDGGHHVDPRVFQAIEGAASLFLVTFEDSESYLSLIWQEIDGIRLLATGESRTLGDIAQRIVDQGVTFKMLATDLGKPDRIHDPDWFKPCVTVDKEFDFSKFGWLTIVPGTDSERRQSPKGSFYIHDGVHKSLVLAKRLLGDGIRFQSVQGLLILPRRA
jgi:hypothetical protein